jgi:23S rRNA (cytidine1920-2'-O)/16S rRNA (cytidine1409-2'-O)-methyltransferase
VTGSRRRVDLLLVERGLCASRDEAQRLLLAGKVFAAGQRVTKPGSLLPTETPLEVTGPACPYVSRGGLKLAHALRCFAVDPAGRVCLDVGASTGGFTDCLLQAGAARVIALDVGYGQLHARLRADPRVDVLERTNVRQALPSQLPAAPDLAVIDVSFISLRLVLPVVLGLLLCPWDVVALIKPQFEVGRGRVGKRGVVRDPALHREVLEEVAAQGTRLGCGLRGLTASPILGPMGNREFLIHLSSDPGSPETQLLVDRALDTARDEE